jgi:hypothetical protein
MSVLTIKVFTMFNALIMYIICLSAVVTADEEVTEGQCRANLDVLKTLAKDVCRSQTQSAIISCGKAGSSLLSCLTVNSLASCFTATFATAECTDKLAAKAICDLQKSAYAEQISQLNTGDCFAFINGDGCSLICEKKDDGINMRGVIDPTNMMLKDAFLHFPSRIP